jgi:hypothetical protein
LTRVNLFRIKLSPQIDSAKFGLFACIFSFGYKFILCALRRLGCHNDRINAPIAGFISAFSLALDVKSRKELIMILILSRAVDTCINLGEGKKIIPVYKHKYVFIWVLFNIFLQSSMAMQPDILNRGLYKFYKKWSGMTKADLQLTEVWTRMLNDKVPYF